MSDINDNVSEQGSDIEQVGGQAESDSEYDSDMYMEGGDSRDNRRGIQKRTTRLMNRVGLPISIVAGLPGYVLGHINKKIGDPTGAIASTMRNYPIIDGGWTGRMHQKVNQENIGKHVIHDPGFRRSVKTATNPVFQHGITQYEAFDLFNGFKTCTVELLDELIEYFYNALSEQDTFTKSEWKKRYPKDGGRAVGKLMVTKDEQKNKQKEREEVQNWLNQPRSEDDDWELWGGSSGGAPEDDDENELVDEFEEDESSKNKVEDKDIAIAFTNNVESFRTGAKFTKGSTMKNSPFEGTDAMNKWGKLKSNDEGKNRSNRYPLGWKEKNKKETAIYNQDPPTFLKLMEREEILAILEHLINIKTLLTITTDIEMARNFYNDQLSDNKKNYLEAMNIKEDEIRDDLFDQENTRTKDSLFIGDEKDILQNIYLTNDAVNKAKKNRDLMAEQEEGLDEEDEGKNIEPDTNEIERNEKNKKALDLYYSKKGQNGITISLPPEFLLKSLEDKEKFEKKK